MMNRIRLSKSVVGQAEAAAVASVLLKSGYLGMGSEVQHFEEELAQYLGVPSHYVVCVNSGTAALQLAVQSALNPGDEVLVQSLTFVATFQAISAAGAVPVPCEVMPGSITIDLKDAKRRITSKTRAIMPVHYAGNSGDLDAIYAFAESNGLRVIEDAAHAFGCRANEKMIGSCGDIVCFSFDGIKNITSGEGGMLVSSDPDVLSKAKDARLLGVEKDTEKRYAGQRSWDFDVTRQGYRFHMSNIFAAIGRVQLQRFLSEFSIRRVELAKLYKSKLSNITGLKMFEMPYGDVIPHIFPVFVKDGKRDELREFLSANMIETGVHYKPNHLLTYFAGQGASLPATELLYEGLLSLPLHPELSSQDIEYVCSMLSQFMNQGSL